MLSCCKVQNEDETDLWIAPVFVVQCCIFLLDASLMIILVQEYFVQEVENVHSRSNHEVKYYDFQRIIFPEGGNLPAVLNQQNPFSVSQQDYQYQWQEPSFLKF